VNHRSRAILRGLVALTVLGRAPSASPVDEWEDDNTILQTGNALFHGSEQRHDLDRTGGGADPDFYIVSTRPFSSYQVVVHGMTGDLDLTSPSLQLLNGAGAVTQNALVLDSGGVLSLDWHAGNLSGPSHGFVRVQGAACGDCGGNDRYSIAFYDTTYTAPRVNNSGTQSSTLLIQNTTERPCNVAQHYFDAAGTHVASGPLLSLAAYDLAVVPTAATFPGQSGSVRVTHTCGYGGLSGKAVAVEAATGFTFDTPFVHRPH
jgi:hypothetical protein